MRLSQFLILIFSFRFCICRSGEKIDNLLTNKSEIVGNTHTSNNFSNHRKNTQLHWKLALGNPVETKCTTPNEDEGKCTPLAKCPILSKTNDKKFLKASRCPPHLSKSKNEPWYCCGKYETFKPEALPETCGVQTVGIRGRILGGRPAILGEFPWLARIVHRNRAGAETIGCSGFLIHRRFVLTAAHCVKNPQIDLVGNVSFVELGEHDTKTDPDCDSLKCAPPVQKIRVKRTIPHRSYHHNSKGHRHDIALIFLEEHVTFNDFVRPLCLTKNAVSTGKFWISGWGQTVSARSSTVKMNLAIPKFDFKNCTLKYGNLKVRLKDGQFCAGGEVNKDSCRGDSGGPLMVPLTKNQWYGVGIVSYGISCGMEGWPGVYTNVTFYYDWIVDRIEHFVLKKNKKANRGF